MKDGQDGYEIGVKVYKNCAIARVALIVRYHGGWKKVIILWNWHEEEYDEVESCDYRDKQFVILAF